MRKPVLPLCLSVVGVVVVTAAILWPLTACACGEHVAKRVACVSNLKQQGIAVAMYATDWDNLLPNRDHWIDQAKQYTNHPEAFRDPEAKGGYGYSYNADLSDKNIEDWTKPERVSLAYDSVNLGPNASDRVTSLPNPGRHGGRNGMVYLDGHAKALPRP